MWSTMCRPEPRPAPEQESHPIDTLQLSTIFASLLPNSSCCFLFRPLRSLCSQSGAIFGLAKQLVLGLIYRFLRLSLSSLGVSKPVSVSHPPTLGLSPRCEKHGVHSTVHSKDLTTSVSLGLILRLPPWNNHILLHDPASKRPWTSQNSRRISRHLKITQDPFHDA